MAETSPHPEPPDKFPLSAAASQLEKCMYGNLQRHKTVEAFKANPFNRDASVGPTEQKLMAGRAIYNAIKEGEIVVIAEGGSLLAPTILDPRLLACVIGLSRGRMTDHVLQMAGRTNEETPGTSNLPADLRTLAGKLEGARLLVSKQEFEKWLAAEKAKRLWPSQKVAKTGKPPRGRTRKDRDLWFNQIERLLNDGTWTFVKSIPALRRALVENGQINVPSEDTLARIVTEFRILRGHVPNER
jgi:hypothetical protein